MRVLYGDVELQMVHLRNATKRPRFSEDGSTYLWTDYTIDMVCIYNPAATSYSSGAAGPVAGPGQLAIKTDLALEAYLSHPRRRLQILNANGIPWIEAPKVGYTVDNNNGPRCTVCSIQEPTGILKTFEVHLIFECSINSCTSDKILLSHRWKRYADVDKDFTTTIVTEGEAVFNLPILEKNGWRPDDFREQLFHAIPNNCKREHIDIQPGSDGYTYRYRLVDREQMYGLGRVFPGTRAEVYKTGTMSKGGVVSSFGQLFGGGGVPNVHGELGVADMASLIHSSANRVIGAVAAASPKYSIHVLVRIWGARWSTRRELRLKAYEILSYQISISIPPALGLLDQQHQLAQEFIQAEDLAGKFVEVQKRVSWGVDNPGLGFIAHGGIPVNIENAFANNEQLLPTMPLGELTNPEPRYQSFGSILEPLVAQGLSSACSLPPIPPEVTQVRHRSLVTGALD